MKTYMSSQERLTIVSLKKNSEQAKVLLKGSLLDAKERGDLKRGLTYINKVADKVIDRLDKDALKTFNNTLKDTQVYIMSNYDINKYVKKKEATLKSAYEDNKEYFKLVELIMHYNCNNCNKCHKDCEIYNEFEKECIPELNGDKPNCKYSYSLEELKNGRRD